MADDAQPPVQQVTLGLLWAAKRKITGAAAGMRRLAWYGTEPTGQVHELVHDEAGLRFRTVVKALEGDARAGRFR